MHDIDFKELKKNKILKIHNVKTEGNTVIAEFTTIEFNRVTMKPYYFTRDQYKESVEKMEVIE